MKSNSCRVAPAMLCAAFIVAVVGTALAQPPKCANQITACGCTIGAAGNYTVENDLSYSQGLTLNHGCIDIEGTDITLTVGSYSIFGRGSSDCSSDTPKRNSGVGIHVLSSASNVAILGGEACGWNYGVESEANNVTLTGTFAFYDNVGLFFQNVTANNCVACEAGYGVTGIEVAGGSQNSFSAGLTGYNSQYGYWLNGTTENSLSTDYAVENGIAGYYLGCNAKGSVKAPIPCVTTSTTGNSLSGNESFLNGKYGFALEKESIHNQILDNEAEVNSKFDFIDANTNCIYNQYSGNLYTTKSPKCIQ